MVRARAITCKHAAYITTKFATAIYDRFLGVKSAILTPSRMRMLKGAVYEVGSDMAGAYAVQTSVGVSEILSLLQRPPPNPVTSPPQRPKANEVYVFKAESEEKQGTIFMKINDNEENFCMPQST